MQWTNIEITEPYLVLSAYNQAQVRTCNWCGANGLYLVTRTSTLSDITYTDPACSDHADQWEALSIAQQTTQPDIEQWREEAVEQLISRSEVAVKTAEGLAFTIVPYQPKTTSESFLRGYEVREEGKDKLSTGHRMLSRTDLVSWLSELYPQGAN